jgi:hypothetical protein
MNEHDWTHVIVHHPDYANKLGIVTAEWSALELHLCFLFQNLLGVASERAEAVFFTLTNNRARREAIASLAKILLPEDNELHDRTNRILRRVRNAATRRNSLAHGIWHFGEVPGSGSAIAFNREKGILTTSPVELKTLDQIIAQVRVLRSDVHQCQLISKVSCLPSYLLHSVVYCNNEVLLVPYDWSVIAEKLFVGYQTCRHHLGRNCRADHSGIGHLHPIVFPGFRRRFTGKPVMRASSGNRRLRAEVGERRLRAATAAG